MPNDDLATATGLIFHDEAFQEEQFKRRQAEQFEAVARGLTLETPNSPDDWQASIRALARRRQAEQVVAQQDTAQRAGPDQVRARVRVARETGDVRGERVPGLNEYEKSGRIQALEKNQTLLDFYGLNPEAAAYAADDTTYASQALDFVTSIPNEIYEVADAGLTGIFESRIQARQAKVLYRLNQLAGQTDNPEYLELQAEARQLARKQRAQAELDEARGIDPFDYYVRVSGNIGGQIADDTIRAGAETAAETAAITAGLGAAGAAVGSVVPGIGTALGGSIGAGAGLLTAAPLFLVNMAKETYQDSTGFAYMRLVDEQKLDPTDPAVQAAIQVEGSLTAAVELVSLGVAGKALGKLIPGSVRARIAQRVLALGPAFRAAQRKITDVPVAAAAEAFEEVIQNSVVLAMSDQIASKAGSTGTGLEAIKLGLSDFEEIVDRTAGYTDQALSSGVDAFVGMAMLGSLYRTATRRSYLKAQARVAKEQQFFEAFAELKDASSMMERDPSTAGKFLDFVLNQDGGERKVYVDRVAFEKGLDNLGVSLEALERTMPGITQELNRARKSGTRLALEPKVFAEQIVGGPMMDQIRQDIASTDRGLTPREIAASARPTQRTADKLTEDAEAKRQERESYEAELDELTQEIVQQIASTRQLSITAAAENATVFRARINGFAQTLSRAAGRRISPREAFQIAPLTILSREQSQQAVVSDDTILAQPAVASAALVINGQTFIGPNHAEAYLAAEEALGTDDFEIESEGFVTVDGEYLDRQQAAERFRDDIGDTTDIGAASEDFAAAEGQIIDESPTGRVVLAQEENQGRGVLADEEIRAVALNALNGNALQLSEEQLAHTSIPIFETPRVEDRRTVREVGQQFQDNATLDLSAPTEENADVVGRMMAVEVLAELQNPESALSWYSDRINGMESIMGLVHPELDADPVAQGTFNLALAITSQGADVATNIDMAERAYEVFKRKGRFPIIGTGKQIKSMKGNFRLVNKMIDDIGIDGVIEAMNGYEDVASIQKRTGKNLQDLAAEIVPMSTILGPKVGRFYQNLQGNFNELTVDLWFSRMWGRMTGNLMDVPTEKTAKTRRDRLRAAATPEVLEALDLDPVDVTGLTDEQLLVLANDINRADSAQGFDRTGPAAQNEVFQAAKNIVEEGGLIDAPKTGTVRKYQRAAVSRALAHLSSLGIEITPAALQATLWYPEKNLYAHQGAGNARSAPTDFEREARRLALQRGVDPGRIDAAVQSARRRRGSGARARLEDRDGRTAASDPEALSTEQLLEKYPAAVPENFLAAIEVAVEAHKFGASVEVKDLEDYQKPGVKLFLTDDQLSGFAVMPDGDIVSAFSHPDAPSGRAQEMLALAVTQGGDHLDAFDTVLPGLYAQAGFRVSGRVLFVDEFSPPGWDYDLFNRFNEGRPDIVFMYYDPENAAPYVPGEGPLFGDYDSAAANNIALAKGVARPTLEQPAYHGTPHRFDEFDITKIGTGEGEQAFGWGLYFSSSRGIAEFYRQTLTARVSGPYERGKVFLDGEEIQYESQLVLKPPFKTTGRLGQETGLAVALRALRSEAAFVNESATKKKWSWKRVENKIIEAFNFDTEAAGYDYAVGAIADLRSSKKKFTHGLNETKKGQLFEVDIPEDNELMNWDRNLSEQSELVRSAVDEIVSRELLSPVELMNADGSVRGYTVGVQRQNGRVKQLSGTGIFDTAEEALDSFRSRGQAFDVFSKGTGAAFYATLEDLLGSPEAASTALAAAGIKGHKYKAGQIAGNTDTDAVNYVIYDDQAVKVAQTFYQPAEQGGTGARAQLALNDNEAIMRLAGTSDLTSFQHEMGHWFLHQMVVAQKLGLSDEQMDADLQTVLDFTGAATVDDLVRPFADRRTQPESPELERPHEIFARAWEAYLERGVAPTPALRKIFRDFTYWVAQVYGDVRAAARRLGQPLTPEITEVFDRLFVADLAVEEAGGSFAEPTIPDPAALGVSEDSPVYQRYQKAWQDAKAKALEQVVRREAVGIRKRKRAEAKRRRAEIRKSVEEEFRSDPAWEAIRWIKRGEPPFGVREEAFSTTNVGMDAGRIAEIYGTEAPQIIEILNAKQFGRGRDMVARPGREGLDPTDVAEIFGFTSEREMINAMLAARTVEQEVQRRTNAQVANNPAFGEEAIYEEAQAAVANGDREKLFRAELRLLRDYLRGATDEEARREVQETGAGTRTADVEARNEAREALKDAQELGDTEAVEAAQRDLIAAEARLRAGTEGRVGQRAAARRLAEIEAQVDTGQMKRLATQLLLGAKAGDLRGERRNWNNVVVREGKLARAAIAKRDYAEAAEHIERQLLAHYAAVEASAMVDRVDKDVPYLAKFRKGKELAKLRTAGYDGAAVVTQLLDMVDFRRNPQAPDTPPTQMERKLRKAIEKTAREEQFNTLAAFKEYAAENAHAFSLPQWIEAGPDEVRHWKQLPVAEFFGLADTVRNVEKIVKATVKDYETGKQVELEEASAAVSERLLANSKRRIKDAKHRAKGFNIQNARAFTRWVDAGLFKPENLIDAMGGDVITNVVRKYLWDPMRQGALRLRGLVDEYVVPMSDLISTFDSSRLREKFIIPELDPERSFTYSEIVVMGLNRGNDSNWFKLTEGYAQLKGREYTEEGFNAALALIKDDDWDRIQGIWDHLESMKGLLFEHEFDQTGRTPVEVEAVEFTTPGGKVMKGGYFPIVYDPDLHDGTRKLASDQMVRGLFGYSHVSAETQQGHLQSRSANVARPILLDMDVIPSHMRRVLHDVAFREPVRNVWAILQQSNVRSAMRETWGDEYLQALETWVKNVAGSGAPSLETSLAMGFGKASQYTRAGTTMVGLGFRVSTGILQLSGMFPSIIESGSFGLSAALELGFRGPRMVSEALEKSKDLRARAQNNDRDLENTIRLLHESGKAVGKVRENAFVIIAIFDRLVSAVAFQAGYKKALSNGASEAQAIEEGDRAIRRSQGASETQDLSNFLGSQNELMKWLSLFGSFMSNLYAAQRRIYRVAAGTQAVEDTPDGTPLNKKRPGHAMALWAGYVFLPALLESLLRGELPDEDDDEGWIKWAAKQVTIFSSAPIPVLGDGVEGALRPETRAFQGRNASSRIIRPIWGTLDNAADFINPEEEGDPERFIRDLLAVTGVGLHLPTGMLDLWVANFWDDYGKAENPVNWVIRNREDN